MELGQLELVQLLEVWSGGLLMLMWLQRERVGLMIDLYLVRMVHSRMSSAKQHG